MQHRQAISSVGFVLLCVALSPGCSVDPSGEQRDASTQVQQDAATQVDAYVPPQTGCDKMDILFMIDNSASMSCEQQQLATAFPAFIDVLETYGETHEGLDYRIGVTTTGTTATIVQEMPDPVPDINRDQTGDDGALRSFFNEPHPWLDGPDPDKDISTLFSQTATVGIDGPPYEMPLQALELFLQKTAPGGVNEGFLRQDAVFALVLITDEDDCSHPKEETSFTAADDKCMDAPSEHNLQTLEYYKQLLDTRFGPDSYVIVVVAGRTACTTSASACVNDDPQHAGCLQAGRRLTDFVENYIGTDQDDYGVFADLCTVDIPMALEAALGKISTACEEFIPVL